MKKIFAILLIAVFACVLAGAAFATEGEPVLGEPVLTDEEAAALNESGTRCFCGDPDDTVRVGWLLLPYNDLDIVERYVPLWWYCGCGDIRPQPYHVKLTATCRYARKIVGKISSSVAPLKLMTKLDAPVGHGTTAGDKELTTGGVALVNGLWGVCNAEVEGKFWVETHAEAPCGLYCRRVTLTIMRQ